MQNMQFEHLTELNLAGKVADFVLNGPSMNEVAESRSVLEDLQI